MKVASKAIIIQKNNYLLQLRDNNKNILYPNRWCFFGGTLKRKENPAICIKRELGEELSIKIKIIMKIYECLNYKTNTYLNYFYVQALNEINIKNLAEGQSLGWFSKEKINVITVIPGYMNTKPFNIRAPSFLISSPEKSARIIYNAIKKEKEIVYINFFWKVIMFCINLIPEKIYKKFNF